MAAIIYDLRAKPGEDKCWAPPQWKEPLDCGMGIGMSHELPRALSFDFFASEEFDGTFLRFLLVYQLFR
jgi:hypothetical protein